MYSKQTLPEAVSHRGLRTAAPENSLPAFLAALDAGAEGIELDVHASGDGSVFVHHDPVFIDGTGVPRQFNTVTSDEIEKAQLAPDTPIPKLDAVLEAVGSRARVYIEIKALSIENDVARCLKRHAASHANYSVHAFDHRVVKRMLELMPSLRTGILQVGYPVDSRAAMRSAGATDLWQHAEFVDERLVADVHSSSGRLIVWTANDESQWKTLSALGVDAICTDRVDAYAAWKNAQMKI
jgi:glycerophosphoryl diester phosphodiesterase